MGTVNAALGSAFSAAINSVLASASAGTGSGTTSSSGIDVQSTVNQILTADRAPEQVWQSQQTTIGSQVSALQTINADLQDLQTQVNFLNDVGGALNSQGASVSDSNVLEATAGAAAIAGAHTVGVGALATTSSYYTGYEPSSSTALTSGTSFSLQVGSGSPVSIAIDGTNNTFDGLAASINKLGLGVTASVITDSGGARLSLVSNASGAPGDLTVSGDSTGLGFTKAAAGTNASLTVDGVPVSSASNTVNVIAGVTLNLLSSSNASVTVNVQPDANQAAQGIGNFVASYNKLVGDINAQFQFNSATNSAGVLAGDSTLQILQQQLFSNITSSVPGAAGNQITTLASLGVNLNDDGTLSIDSTKLQDALTGNYQDVQNFFQTASTGFSQQFGSLLTSLTDPTSGAVSSEIKSLQSNSSDLTNQINDFEAQLAVTQQQLTTQYSTINTTLQQLPSLLSQINNQLASVKL